ncbi:hypothetical protein AAFF_G00413280 [Aldrovandia affinis]|uniref:Uncharacterized protein n=1 Tax=Aldrovandia affinis TaxID=143900 RepID=A0AAD7SB42_9TELE|nr:hypothetical protein AAFF_G00413280 [Aldrovandia affinis]
MLLAVAPAAHAAAGRERGSLCPMGVSLAPSLTAVSRSDNRAPGAPLQQICHLVFVLRRPRGHRKVTGGNDPRGETLEPPCVVGLVAGVKQAVSSALQVSSPSGLGLSWARLKGPDSWAGAFTAGRSPGTLNTTSCCYCDRQALGVPEP